MTRDEAQGIVESMTDGEVLALCAFLDMLNAIKAEEAALND